MNDLMLNDVLIALLITFAAGLATVLGSALVFFQKTPSPRMLAFGLAFAGGAMVFVSLTEILGKSVSSFGLMFGASGFNYATFSFLAGLIAVMVIDRLIPNPHATLDADDPKFKDSNEAYIKRIGILAALAITAHNFPEGLATFFATLESPTLGAPLALAIAVHNIPEGISIAAPIYYATRDKKLTVFACLISGLAEPLGAILGYLILSPFLSPAVFGMVFGVIAGVMVFLAMDELLPAAKRYSDGHETVYGLVGGMVVMALSLVLFHG
ncbi:zinc transporter ZupT [Moraxella caviae]|uniref:Zinc transporter ZupT n=1 Tax=Moraxella caviae TaxID=34060 RepID=A0A1S9ZW36_9GAMM|nr:zinc transporter ZupT [Moraxella caviae]OOR87746.1 zinc transporter ZupT [Moraxella caviae]STZ10158.1 Zinc transporter ZupT [Moraxella caviae]